MRLILAVFIISAVAVYTFSVLPSTIFQQDEWLGLGGAISRQESGGLLKVVHDVFVNPSSRFLPLTGVVNYLVFTTFKSNFPLYGYFAIILAIVNSTLVYLFVGRLVKSRLVGLLTALFWVTNGISFQAISWISPVVPSQFSFMFMLLGLIYFQRFLASPKPKLALLVISLVVTSLFFKEAGIFYFVTFVVMAMFSPHPKPWRWLAVIVFLPVIFTQLVPGLFKSHAIGQSFSNLATPDNAFYNLLLVPARSLSQTLIPIRPLYTLIYAANQAHYTNLTDGFVVESIIGDVISLLGSCLILLFIALGLCLIPKSSTSTVFISLASFLASCLPFVFFVSLSTILEPRFYVFPVLWVGVLLFTLVSTLISQLRLPVVAKNCLVVFLTLPLIGFHVHSVKKYMQTEVATSQTRLAILNTINKDTPTLTADTIFYFFTTNNGFYAFQSGTGQMLATWLHSSGKIPNEALIDLDFWESGYEGIKSYSTGKYGYFSTLDKLVAAYKNDPTLAITAVHAYYWNTQDNSVTNVSSTIQAQLISALQQ